MKKNWIDLQKEFLVGVMEVDLPPEKSGTVYHDPEMFWLHMNLIMEEMKELSIELAATFANPVSLDNQSDLLKEMVDVVYVIIGLANTFNMPLDEAFRRVHNANMSKVDANGNVTRDKNGKVLKPEGYQEANVIDLFEHMKH